MKKMRKWLALLLACAMLLSMLAACGSSESTEEDTEEETAAEETTETTEEEEAETEEDDSVEETVYDDDAVIVIAGTNSYADLTPFDSATGNYASSMLNSLIYDHLVYVSKDGTITARAATSWEQSEDGLTLTFTLREDSLFHDGSQVTASDWVYAMTLLATPECGFADISLMSNIAGTDESGAIVEGEEFGVVAVDDFTLSITFKSVVNMQSFLISDSYVFTALPESILSEYDLEDMASCDFFSAPIGSGPCVFNSVDAANTVYLDKFEDYYDTENSHWSQIQVKTLEADTMPTAILAGEIDFGYTVVSDDAALLEGEDGVTVVYSDALDSAVVACINSQLISDVRVRQAIQYALDKDLMAEAVGNAVGANTYLDPSSSCYPESLSESYYDVEEAQALLQEAIDDGAWDEDTTIIIGTNSDTTRATLAVLMQQMLEAVGFNVEIEYMQSSTLFADLVLGEAGTYSIGLVFYSVSSDPASLDSLFDYQNATYLSVDDPTYVEYQEAIAAVAGDEEEYTALVQEYQEYIFEQSSLITLINITYGYVPFSSRMGDEDFINHIIDYPMRNLDVWNWAVLKED